MEVPVSMGGRPGAHECWVHRDAREFEEAAHEFLEEGRARRERVLLLTAAETERVYAAGGRFDPREQLVYFQRAAIDARRDGYTGLRVAADGTPLLRLPGGVATVGRYEHLVDRFLSTTPAFTALCGYDASTIDEATVAELAALHSCSFPADAPFHVVAGPGCVRLTGEVDWTMTALLERTLSHVAPERGQRLVVDVAGATFIDRQTLAALDRFAGSFDGVVVLRHASAVLRRLCALLTTLARVEVEPT